VAGVLSLTDAAKVVAARGRLMGALPAGGAMIAVAAGEDEVGPLLTGGVAIAAVNAPDAVVISGAEAPVAAIADGLARRGTRVHRLAVSHAFHSPLIEPMLDDFHAVLTQIASREPRLHLISNLTGQPAADGYGSPQYWVQHARHPVRFLDGVQTAERLGAGAYVEVGPGGALSVAVEQSLTTQTPATVVTMAKDRPEAESLLAAAGRLFTVGAPVNWGAVLPRGRRIPLPTYGFDRQRYWLGAGPHTPASAAVEPHELADRMRQLPPDEQRRQLVQLVSKHAAAVLGHSDSHAIDADRAFADLGFDSLTGVELRNRLKGDTGLALSRTLVFDYPNPTALADHLRQQLLRDDLEYSDDEQIWVSLRKIPIQELRRTGLLDKLLLLAGGAEGSPTEPKITDDAIDALSPEALIAMALKPADDDVVE
jgi:acyl transferase domain-containing protein